MTPVRAIATVLLGATLAVTVASPVLATDHRVCVGAAKQGGGSDAVCLDDIPPVGGEVITH